MEKVHGDNGKSSCRLSGCVICPSRAKIDFADDPNVWGALRFLVKAPKLFFCSHISETIRLNGKAKNGAAIGS
jgi:hypothetical protein